jgi:hypothetical protein
MWKESFSSKKSTLKLVEETFRIETKQQRLLKPEQDVVEGGEEEEEEEEGTAAVKTDSAIGLDESDQAIAGE